MHGNVQEPQERLVLVAEKVDGQAIVARDNAAHGIADRRHVTNVSTAHELHAGELVAISGPYTARSLQPQEAFSLRRDESIEPWPAWADRSECCA